MLEELKQEVHEANRRLVEAGLVLETFGNVSGVDREGGHLVIKPSGASYEAMLAEHMVVVSLETGKPAEGELNPSSDTPTHRAMYRAFSGIGGVVHTHSLHATAWAQAQREIPPLGTTHSDYFPGPIVCTRARTVDEIQADYEANTGKVIVERLAGIDPAQYPGVLVAWHGPFVWGASPDEAVHNAIAVEYLARLAGETLAIQPYPLPMPMELQRKHFLRKHGPDAYYGQEQ